MEVCSWIDIGESTERFTCPSLLLICYFPGHGKGAGCTAAPAAMGKGRASKGKQEMGCERIAFSIKQQESIDCGSRVCP